MTPNQIQFLQRKYNYKFDLAKFFYSINLDYLNHALREMGYPESLINEIEKINLSIPLNPGTGKPVRNNDLTCRSPK